MEDALEPHALFGGAMTLAIPARFADISDFRPIPDHQEVFADAAQDQSLIVEILEHAAVPDEDAAPHFFQDLADQNAAEHAQVECLTALDPRELPLLRLPGGGAAAPPVALLTGQQAVAKGRQGAEALNKIHVLLAVVRLPGQGSDLVLTLNTPIYISENSASAAAAGAGYKPELAAAAGDLFRRMLATLQVNDWGLFGG